MSSGKRKTRPLEAGLLLGFWLALVSAGYGLLYEYAFTAGAAAEAPSTLPAELGIEARSDRPMLVMVAHPRCSCTRASLAELARLMSRLSGRLDAYVLFQRPAGTPVGWERTDLWESAARIEGVTALVDEGGAGGDLLGASTSGQTYLFAPDGRLLFAGGITPSRSHQGNSVGRERIIALVEEGVADRSESAVYGCPLDEQDVRSADRPRSLLEVAEFGAQE